MGEATGDLIQDSGKPAGGDEGTPEPKPEETPKPEDGKTEDGGKPEDTPGDGEKPSDAGPVVPENYELKPPEGTQLDEHLVAVATPLFKENKWSQETAQQAVNVFSKVREAEVAAFEEMKTANDAELRKNLGEDYAPTQQRIGSLLTAYKTQVGEQDYANLMRVVDDHGLGSDGVLVKFLDWAAKGLKTEDSVGGTGSGGGKPDPKEAELDVLRREYPSMFNEDGTPKASNVR